jgi:hypothetical protein
VINSVAVLGATVADLFLVATLASTLPVTVALGAAVLWRMTPEVWEVSTYAHPWTLALPFFFAGAWLAAATTSNRTPRAGWAIVAVLFAAAFAIRIDLILFVPLLLVAAYLRSPRAPVALAASLVAAGILLFEAQRAAVGRELTSGALSGFWQALSAQSVAVNLGVCALGGGLGTLLLLTLGTPRHVANGNQRRGLRFFACALLPAALWLGIPAGPARHFGPVYVAAAVFAAVLLAQRLRGVAFGAGIAALVMANAALAEGAFYIARNAPARTVQLGVRRRVIERVPLGNVWSNHRAKAQLNDLDAAYASWALDCAAIGPLTVYVQGPPFRLSVDATARFHDVRIDDTGFSNSALLFGSADARLWLVPLPEGANLEWWSRLRRSAAVRGTEVVLLGPRIPGVLAATWQTTQTDPAVVVGAETPGTIAARPCPTGIDRATLTPSTVTGHAAQEGSGRQ